MLLAEAKIKANAELARCVEVANRVYKTNYTAPPMRWDVRGTTAGYAVKDWLIRLNPGLLCQNPDEIAPTVAHEFAHLVDAKLNPETRDRGIMFSERGGIRRKKRSIHGPTWAAIMIVFGHQPDRCHTMDTSSVRVKARVRYVYRCPVCKFEGQVGPKHHKALQTRGAKLSFKRCGRGHSIDRTCYVGPVGATRAPVIPQPEFKPNIPQPQFKPSIPQTPPRHEIPSPAARPRTKQDQVISMMRTYPADTPRSEFVRLIMQNLGMSKAGAETYYYNAKKRLAG